MPIYQAIYDGPPRGYTKTNTKKLYIAIHCTANTASAENEASYAKRRTDSTSSHYYVDNNSIVQSLDTNYRAWHAGSSAGNDRAIAYEITGHVNWSRQKWLDSVAWNLLAAQIKKDMAAHGIAARKLSVSEIKAGKLTGIITHNDMRLAWGGTDHTDPGPNFPMDHLMKFLQGSTPKEEDELTPEEAHKAIWKRDAIRAPEGYDEKENPTWTAENVLRSAHLYARSAWARTKELAAGQEAILAAVTGQDVVAAVKAELAKHEQAMNTRLAAMAEAMTTAVMQAMPEANQATVEAAIKNVLRRGLDDA